MEMNKTQMEEQITIIYDIITKDLKGLLPASKPKLVFTKAKTFWGRIRKTQSRRVLVGLDGKPHAGMLVNNYKDIRISSSLFYEEFKGQPYEDFLSKIIETICHELAHMTHWNHKEEHTQLTQEYLDIVGEAIEEELDILLGSIKVEEPIKSIAQSAKEVTTLKDLTSDPRKARALLRKAGIDKPGTKWEWTGTVPKEIMDIIRDI